MNQEKEVVHHLCFHIGSNKILHIIKLLMIQSCSGRSLHIFSTKTKPLLIKNEFWKTSKQTD